MIKIKNWDSFQHYRDRNPPWIKLHRRLLNDREFFSLDGDCVKTLVLLWMLAAETKDGELPSIEDIAFRLRLDSKVLASQISKLNHWLIVDDSDMLADCTRHGSKVEQSAPSETETERETETENRDKVTRTRALDDDQKQIVIQCGHSFGKTKIDTDRDFNLFWEAYPKKVGKKASLKAFQNARKSDLPQIGILIAAIEQQRKSDQWRRDGGQYIPNPATWLNRGQWDDSIQAGTGRKLLPQEETQQMLSEWVAEKEEQEKNGFKDTGFLFTGNIRELPGPMEADETDD